MSWLAVQDLFRRAPDARGEAEIEAEVRAELEHHLACAERELVEHGRSPAEARAEARERFGDVERVRDACFRLWMGERLMLQRLHFAATLLLLVAVLGLAWAQLAFRKEAKALAESQRQDAAARMEAAIAAAQGKPSGDPIVIRVGDELLRVIPRDADPIACFESVVFAAF